MPRKRDKEKAIKSNGIRSTVMAERKKERKQALKTLELAKEQEAKKIKAGHRWCSDGKTRWLIKPR